MPTTRRFLSRLSLATTLLVAATVAALPASTTSAAGVFEALAAPQRIVDTRPDGDTVDDVNEKTGIVAGGSTLTVQVAGRAGVPDDADTAVLNVTVTNTARGGFLTIFPCDQPQPNAANLNYAPNQVIANAVFAKLDPSGRTCIFTSADAHVIVDATGSLPSGSFSALPSPQRVVDTRPSGETADGVLQKIGANAAGTALAVPVAGRAGIADDATVAVLNITVIRPESRGFVTVYPCDQPQPLSANLNYSAGDIVANSVIAKLDSTGAACVFTSARTDVVVDVSGSLPTATYAPLAAPQRIVETRPGERTADGDVQQIGFRRAGTTLELPIGGRVGIPDDASAVILNVTALGASRNGYVTAHPRNSPRPNAANLNYTGGQVFANTVVAKLGGDGKVCMFASADVEMIVDVAGYLVGDAPVDTGAGCPMEFPPTDLGENVNYPVGPYQLPPGRYIKAETPSGFCDLDRRDAPDFTGFIAGTSTFFGTQLMLDVQASDAFVSYEGGEDCGLLRRYVAPETPPTSFPSQVTTGIYVVGDHVGPGTYRTTVPFGEICVASRLRDFSGFVGGFDTSPMEIVRVDSRYDTPSDQLSITVRPGDPGARFGGVCVWTRS